MLFLSRKRLESLEVISLIQVDIVKIVLEVTVIFNSLVEPSEVTIKVRLVQNAMEQSVEAHMEATVELEVRVLVVVCGDSALLCGATESLLFSVLVDAPQIVDTLVGGLVVVVSEEECGSSSPEKDVLKPKLEDSYKFIRDKQTYAT